MRGWVIRGAVRLCLLLCAFGEFDEYGLEGQESFPRKPIRVIVPFAVGGGSDTFVRILTHALRESEISDQPFTVLNVPGAGGTIGSRQAKNSRADGYTLLNLHEGILTAKYSGTVSYGPEAFESVMATGRVGMVIAAKADGPIESLESLMQRIEVEPDQVRFAANLGAPSHFSGLLLEAQAQEGRFRFVQVGGSAKRFSAVIGGHAEVSVFSVSEFVQFQEGGLRGLALLSDVRSAAIPDVPTAKEIGVNLVFSNTQYWWLPKGTDPVRRDVIADILEKAMALPSVRERLESMHIDPIVVRGEALGKNLSEREAAIASLALRRPVDVPGLSTGLLVALGVLGSVFSVVRIRSREVASDDQGERSLPWFSGVVLVRCALVLGYLVLLGSRVLPFSWLTFVFVTGLGASLSDRPMKHLILILFMGGLMGFGIGWIFGEWFQIDLPSSDD